MKDLTKIKENLKTIQCFAELALDNHKRSGVKFTGVNYLDLRISDVWVKYSLGDSREYYGITIEECSPYAGDLYEYMNEYLQEHLPDDLGCCIDVELEW